MKVYELIRDTLMEMGIMETGNVTGSPSKTVLTDANAGLTADLLIKGTLYALDGTNAGSYRRITDNAATTITVVSAMTASFSTGDYYGFTKKDFRSQDMVLYVNMALMRIGNIGIKDTSITTASNQTEYTFPVALKKGDVRGIYIQGNTNDSDDNQWVNVHEWHIEPGTAGNTSLIILPQYESGRTIKIEYLGNHAAVTSGVSEIDEAIHPELAKAALKVVLNNRRTEGAIGTVDGYNQLYNKYDDELDKMRIRYPVWKPVRQAEIFTGRAGSRYKPGGEPNKVDIS